MVKLLLLTLLLLNCSNACGFKSLKKIDPRMQIIENGDKEVKYQINNLELYDKARILILIREKKGKTKILRNDKLSINKKPVLLSDLNFKIEYPVEIKDPIFIHYLNSTHRYNVSSGYYRTVVNDEYEILSILSPKQLKIVQNIDQLSYIKIVIDKNKSIYCVFGKEKVKKSKE